MKEFNTTEICIPSKHYMVDLSESIEEIKKLVDTGKYFTISRARLYGKTTTLIALEKILTNEYVILSLNFNDMNNNAFENGTSFSKEFTKLLLNLQRLNKISIPGKILDALEKLNKADSKDAKMDELFRILKRWIIISEKPIVLIIDEIDRAVSYQSFLDFLAQLRKGYISRDADNTPAFYSVILVGVTNIKYLKSNTEDGFETNGPWNIAADFDVDMSLSKSGIKGMLDEYKAEHQISMNTTSIAESIWEYTSGYPFLVSRICQLIDTEVNKTIPLTEAWTNNGVSKAVKLMLSESNTLFQSITEALEKSPELKASIHNILIEDNSLSWNLQVDTIHQMKALGLIRNDNNRVRISNRIFELMLYNLFQSKP